MKLVDSVTILTEKIWYYNIRVERADSFTWGHLLWTLRSLIMGDHIG